MTQAVHCGTCGKLLNSSQINSHKRLAHPDLSEKILVLFRSLSEEQKKKVLMDLIAISKK